MQLKITIFFGFLFCLAGLSAQIPPGYYDPANGLTGQALQAALHNIIKNHNAVSYNSLISYFVAMDKKSDNRFGICIQMIPGKIRNM